MPFSPTTGGTNPCHALQTRNLPSHRSQTRSWMRETVIAKLKPASTRISHQIPGFRIAEASDRTLPLHLFRSNVLLGWIQDTARTGSRDTDVGLDYLLSHLSCTRPTFRLRYLDKVLVVRTENHNRGTRIWTTYLYNPATSPISQAFLLDSNLATPFKSYGSPTARKEIQDPVKCLVKCMCPNKLTVIRRLSKIISSISTNSRYVYEGSLG